MHRNPVIVGKFTEEHVPSLADVHRMLHEALRVLISFENLELGPERKAEKAQTWRDLRGVAVLVVAGMRPA